MGRSVFANAQMRARAFVVASALSATLVASWTPFALAAEVTPTQAGLLAFAGSKQNLASLTAGLRTGTKVTLSSDSKKSVSFWPPTRPLGYGSVTRALDLASRQLAAAGIEQPTPSQVRAALVGGPVTTPDGNRLLEGVLTLRSDGLGWGQIAQAIERHPSAIAGGATGAGAIGLAR